MIGSFRFSHPLWTSLYGRVENQPCNLQSFLELVCGKEAINSEQTYFPIVDGARPPQFMIPSTFTAGAVAFSQRGIWPDMCIKTPTDQCGRMWLASSRARKYD